MGAARFDVHCALDAVRQRIESAGGRPDDVRIVAVTKGFGPESVLAAAAAGMRTVGENYAQELVAKHSAVGERSVDVRWHFLGAVQRNKVATLAPLVDCWQGVTRLAEGHAIARRAPGATVLVEVDVTGARGRNGCAPAQTEQIVDGLKELGLDVRGLMTVAPAGGGPDAARAFQVVRGLADRLGLVERSMGMSGDLELAVAEGSTMVRLGRALFGERPPRGRSDPAQSETTGR